MQIGILEPLDFSEEASQLLSKIGSISFFGGDNLEKFLKPLDVLFVRLSYRVDSVFLSKAPNLSWVVTPTTGHTHLDADALKQRNIRVVSLRGEQQFLRSIRATPEHTFGLLLAILRHVPVAVQKIAANQWDRYGCRGEELFGNSVGIIGLGRVGERVAFYCEHFGASVNWYDPFCSHENNKWKRFFSVESLIRESRAIVLCASHSTEHGRILKRSEVELLVGRYFVNTARAELVDCEALFDIAKANRLAGLALDVIEDETSLISLTRWKEIILNRNIIITPHIAGATFSAMEKTEIFCAKKLLSALK